MDDHVMVSVLAGQSFFRAGIALGFGCAAGVLLCVAWVEAAGWAWKQLAKLIGNKS